MDSFESENAMCAIGQVGGDLLPHIVVLSACHSVQMVPTILTVNFQFIQLLFQRIVKIHLNDYTYFIMMFYNKGCKSQMAHFRTSGNGAQFRIEIRRIWIFVHDNGTQMVDQ